MSERNNSNGIGFIYKISSFPRAALSNAVLNEDFASKIKALVTDGKSIDDNTIYETLKDVYFHKLELNERSGEALRLRKAVKRMSWELFGDSQRWQQDFESYLNAK